MTTRRALPSVGVRIGVADAVDVGIRLAQFSSLEGDVKINFLKTPGFDMAIAPGLQAAYFSISSSAGTTSSSSSFGLFYFNVPLLLGINFSRTATLVLTPGFAYALATGSANDGSGTSTYATGSAPLARLGVGFNIRAGNSLAIQPEVTALRGFNSAEATIWNFGVGFAFRTSKDSMPDYSDVP